VEDDPTIRSLLDSAVRLRGYRFIGADTGDEAWRLVCSERPDVVLLDVRLPGAEELEVCRSIRSDPSLHRTAVVVLTAWAEARSLAAAAGADAFLTKPFLPSRLLDLLAALTVR
jgi:two-component system, OmpR family, response regulator